MATKKEKEETRSLEQVIQEINSGIGDGSVFLLSDDSTLACEVVPTGIPEIDAALGVGGFPKGRITEVFGTEACGKTTLCLHAAAAAQKAGETVAIIDAEHALSPGRMADLGVQKEKTIISQPENGEHALTILEALILSQKVSYIIVDSVAALTPRAEIDKDFGDAIMGMHARLMSQAMRKLVALISKNNVAVVFTNQVRSKIGSFVAEYTPTGGNALKFYASIRIQLRRIGQILRDGHKLASKYKLSVIKNKLAVPYKEVEYTIVSSGFRVKKPTDVDAEDDASLLV